MYLGRPWRAYAMTLYMECLLPDVIHPEGWDNWRNPENEKTARYAEYKNTGPGSDSKGRVSWSKQLTKKGVRQITPKRVFEDWNPLNSLTKSTI
jgi:pectinesterase